MSEYFNYKFHLSGVNQIKWNNEGSLLASAGNDCQINIVDLNKVLYIFIQGENK